MLLREIGIPRSEFFEKLNVKTDKKSENSSDRKGMRR